ncbi:hypothetical protein [Anaeromassilibacillus sp. An200]|uniref:hypothetical protein n=1 Tax=Anaeromassilibacillus sp. An200 TaxID=1965587 RepID=UPI000B381FBE|nr:hypothetical protein [Anaeromassilibacillus sp. An200]OUP06575.1 hypothetical protein B5F35_15295 [Anaeromassilibacillus sp. An200]
MRDDNYSWYISKLGYTIVNQGESGFQVICRGNVPIGFLADDGKISCIQGEESEVEALGRAADFVKQYADYSPVGDHEYLIGKFGPGSLTAYFDMESKQRQYAVYGADGQGTVFPENEYQKAVLAFFSTSGLQELLPRKSVRKKDRLRLWMLRKLMGGEKKELKKDVPT